MAGGGGQLRFLDWYLKIAAVSALIGASMELFMIHTGFCACCLVAGVSRRSLVRIRVGVLVHHLDDKVTVLESEKRAWESSPEAQAMKEALNPWRRFDEEKSKP